MSDPDRLRRLKKSLGVKWMAVAYLFGVSESLVIKWLAGESKMTFDCKQTLERLEKENGTASLDF